MLITYQEGFGSAPGSPLGIYFSGDNIKLDPEEIGIIRGIGLIRPRIGIIGEHL